MPWTSTANDDNLQCFMLYLYSRLPLAFSKSPLYLLPILNLSVPLLAPLLPTSRCPLYSKLEIHTSRSLLCVSIRRHRRHFLHGPFGRAHSHSVESTLCPAHNERSQTSPKSATSIFLDPLNVPPLPFLLLRVRLSCAYFARHQPRNDSKRIFSGQNSSSWLC